MDIQLTIGEIDLATVIDDRMVYTRDGELDHQPITVADAIVMELTNRFEKDRDLYPPLREAISRARIEIIHAALAPIVADAMAAPVQKTNSMGDPIGNPVSMRELVIAEVRAFLSKRTGDYRSDRTVVSDMIKTEVERTIKAELSEAIADEKAKVVAAIRASAATLIADAIKQGIGR